MFARHFLEIKSDSNGDGEAQKAAKVLLSAPQEISATKRNVNVRFGACSVAHTNVSSIHCTFYVELIWGFAGTADG